MKHNKRYILPKLIGVTIIAGIATLIIATIFKLLLLGTVVAGIGTLIASRFKRRNERRYLMASEVVMPMSFYPKTENQFAVKPNYNTARNQNLAIVPIY